MFFSPAIRNNIAQNSRCRFVVVPLLSALALGVFGLSSAFAVEVPASVSPGQVEKRFQPEVTPATPLQLNMPSPVEAQKIPEAMRAQLEKSKFVLKSVIIEGSTVYSSSDFKALYAAKIGQTISLLDAKMIANGITNQYHNDGYILSQAIVPTQDVSNGVLWIRVVEGFIGSVTFAGDHQSEIERKLLEAYADSIKALHPTRLADLERYMLLMNDLPGATVTGLIRPSSAEFGAADLVLTIERKSFEGSYSFDNRGSKYLGPWQHTASFGANSLFDAYDHTQVRVETVDPFKELFGIEVEHDELLDSEGTKLSFLASHTRTQPGDSLKSLDVVGYSDLFEAKISHPFLRLREQSLVGRAVFDVRNTTTDVFTDQALATDRLRIARVGGTYSFLDNIRGSNSIDIQLSQGMNIFNATSSGDVRSNAIGDSAFTKTNFDLSRLQQLPNNFSLLTAATGQYSFDPLLTDEQFSLGGTDYGRAFDPAEALGDSGLAGKTELRYGEVVGEAYFNAYQLYTFYDIGEAWVRGAAAGTSSNVSMSSMGVGTRVTFTEYLSSSLELDVPVIKPADDQTAYRHSPRIFYTLSAHF